MQMETDLFIAGSGAAGLTAAVVAGKAGLRVLLAESTALFGGTTALSGGGAWVPNNHYQAAMGVIDSEDQARRYLRAVIGTRFEEAKIEAYLDQSPQMLRYLEAESEVKFGGTPVPDYEPSADGASVGRTIRSLSYDGRLLGTDLQLLRKPLPQMGFLGMQIDGSDVSRLATFHRSASSFRYSAKLFLSYLAQRAVHGHATRLTNGNALVARLIRSARLSGVQLWNNARVVRLIKTAHGVAGAVLLKDGKETEILARKGVILATGGFGANDAMRSRYITMAEHGWSLQPEGNQGDGVAMGIAAEGMMQSDNSANGIWIPVSAMKDKRGKNIVFPHAMLDRHCPGSMIVDSGGRRFVNESFHYQHFGEVMRAKGIARCHLIGDLRFVRTYGMGLVRPGPFPLRSYIRNGYLIEAMDIPELARKIDVDPATLQLTISTFNSNAVRGHDPDFHRGEDDYSRFMGDTDHKPNSTLGSLSQPPYYAVELRSGDFCTLCGLETDATARVLDDRKRIIPGLYAIGLDMNTPWRGAYPGGGAGIGPAMTFAYIAARDIAGRS